MRFEYSLGMKSQKFSVEYTIDKSMIDSTGNVALSGIEKLLVDTGSLHVQKLGYGTNKMFNIGYTWILAKMSMKIINLPKIGDRILIETWPIEGGKIAFNRDFEVKTQSGDVLIFASSRWCVIDIKNRRPVPKQIFGWNVLEIQTNPAIDINYYTPKIDENTPICSKYIVKKTDLDFNNHMTNTRYFDIAIETIKMQESISIKNSLLQLRFENETTCGENICLYYINDGNNYIVKGISENNNKQVFDFYLQTNIK